MGGGFPYPTTILYIKGAFCEIGHENNNQLYAYKSRIIGIVKNRMDMIKSEPGFTLSARQPMCQNMLVLLPSHTHQINNICLSNQLVSILKRLQIKLSLAATLAKLSRSFKHEWIYRAFKTSLDLTAKLNVSKRAWQKKPPGPNHF